MENPDFSARTNRTVVIVTPLPTEIEAGNQKGSRCGQADNFIMNEIAAPANTEAPADITRIPVAPCMIEFVSMPGDYRRNGIRHNRAKRATVAGRVPA